MSRLPWPGPRAETVAKHSSVRSAGSVIHAGPHILGAGVPYAVHVRGATVNDSPAAWSRSTPAIRVRSTPAER